MCPAGTSALPVFLRYQVFFFVFSPGNTPPPHEGGDCLEVENSFTILSGNGSMFLF